MLVTVSGGSGAGKTTLASELAGTTSIGPVRLLHGDDYYVTDRERGVWVRDEWDVPRLDVGDPASLDLERLSLDAGAALNAAGVVIVDGLFARLVEPRVSCARFDVFVDLPADLRLVRKIRRKCLRDGFPLDVLLRNYVEHRRDAHERHVEPLRDRCDLVVDGGLDPGSLARQIGSAISAVVHPGR
jgi:uridine kinase